MKHADRLIERILFLEGLPNLARTSRKLLIGESAQLGLVDQLGLQNWLQSQAGSPS